MILGAKRGSFLIDRYFQMPGGVFLARLGFEEGGHNLGGQKGAKRVFFAKMYFLMPGRGFLARDHFLRREGTTGGSKGPFLKNGFLIAWARIHGERPLFEEGGHKWGDKY